MDQLHFTKIFAAARVVNFIELKIVSFIKKWYWKWREGISQVCCLVHAL